MLRTHLWATRSLVVVALSAALPPFAIAQGIPLDESDFTSYVAALVQKEVGDAKVIVTDLLTIKLGNLQANLSRIHALCRRKEGRCYYELEEYVKGAARVAKDNATPQPETLKGAYACSIPSGVNPNRIVPVVRATKSVERELLGSPRTVATHRINGELTIVFAEDTSGAVSYFLVPENEVSCWEGNDALSRSLENLPHALGRLRIFEVEPTLYLVTVGGNYEASLILLGSSLRKFAPGATGELVVGIPSRDVFLISGKHNSRAIASLRARVSRLFATVDRPLSDKLFVVTDESIQVFGD